ncbi:hypothetical protein E4H12_04315 [Candidatus Thorarchaeota archaeon]|nr:hypothetical protein [Candidatus Thorarchaeota archaeon]TFG98975.1 MAG: hypothetical protein E4H12_04315 [Candidatus Thorarchaeota archaeon]
MLNSRECPKCGSSSLAGPHRIFSEGPVRIDLPGISTATLESITCTNCGYTELYSDRLGLENIRKNGRILQRNPHTIPQGNPRICGFCGTKASPDATYCPECGNNF